MDLIQARPGHMHEVRNLFREYEESLGCDLCFQGFEDELDGLPGDYVSPHGTLIVARNGESLAGCVALRRQQEGICEMKRLYVRPSHRGTGLGRELAEAAVGEARKMGYRTIRLDTLDRLKAAMKLYESLGFQRTDPYYPNPLEGVVYWELQLL